MKCFVLGAEGMSGTPHELLKRQQQEERMSVSMMALKRRPTDFNLQAMSCDKISFYLQLVEELRFLSRLVDIIPATLPSI